MLGIHLHSAPRELPQGKTIAEFPIHTLGLNLGGGEGPYVVDQPSPETHYRDFNVRQVDRPSLPGYEELKQRAREQHLRFVTAQDFGELAVVQTHGKVVHTSFDALYQPDPNQPLRSRNTADLVKELNPFPGARQNLHWVVDVKNDSLHLVE